MNLSGFFTTILQWFGFTANPVAAKTIDRAKVTEQFQKFEIYQIEEDKRAGTLARVREDLMCMYILNYQKSPFEGDDDLREAQKLLCEQHILRNIFN